MLAWRARTRLEAKRGEWARAAEAWEQLARLAGWLPRGRTRYLRRAAEVWDARVGRPGARRSALRVGCTRRSRRTRRWRWRWRGCASCAARSSKRRRCSRRTGARAAGGRGASARWRRARPRCDARIRRRLRSRAGASAGARRSATAAQRARGAGARVSSRGRSARAASRPIERLAAPIVDARRGVGLFRGRRRARARARRDARGARQAFKAAADREPDDLLLHAGRVMLYRQRGKYAELAAALKALIGARASRSRRRRGCYRQLARVAGEHLGDQKTAQQSYEKALELQPDDVTTLHAFARLCGETRAAGRARSSCASRRPRAPAGARAAALLVRDRRHLREAARRRRFGARASTSARSSATTSACRRWRRWRSCTAGTSGLPELLDVLRRELKLAADKDRQLELYLELARAADQARRRRSCKAALGAYRDALRIDPAQRGGARRASSGCAVARAVGRAGRGAPARAALDRQAVRALCEALERLESWEELAEAREAELALLDRAARRSRARRARWPICTSGGSTISTRAARAWHRVDEADPRDPQAARALQRIYESRGRYADLAAAIERELQLEASLEAGAAPRAVAQARRDPQVAAVASRVGGRGVREGARGRSDTTATRWRRWPRSTPRSKRADDLNRVLDLRAAGDHRSAAARQRALAKGRSARAQRRSRRRARGVHRVVQARSGVSRTCFTAFERVCYRKREVAAGDGAVRRRRSGSSRCSARAPIASPICTRGAGSCSCSISGSRARRRRRTCACSSSIPRPTPRRRRSSASSRRSRTGPG